MNEIVSKYLLARNKFLPEIHLKHFGFTYSACGTTSGGDIKREIVLK